MYVCVLSMYLMYVWTHCNTLQHSATLYNTLQYTATHCNKLQHTATHCSMYVMYVWYVCICKHVYICV